MSLNYGPGYSEPVDRTLVFEKKSTDGSLKGSYYHCKATDWKPCAQGFEEAMHVGYQMAGTKVTVKFEVTNIRTPPSDCRHDNWECRGNTAVGMGYCLLCEKEIPLPLLINRLKRRLEDALAAAKRS